VSINDNLRSISKLSIKHDEKPEAVNAWSQMSSHTTQNSLTALPWQRLNKTRIINIFDKVQNILTASDQLTNTQTENVRSKIP
jgi:hypothetical protein